MNELMTITQAPALQVPDFSDLVNKFLMSRFNNYDDDDYRAFVFNESRISTDDREIDEFSYELLDSDMKIFNTDEL